jgi:hypothetical protein
MMEFIEREGMARARAAHLASVMPPNSYHFFWPNLQILLAMVICLSLNESVAGATGVSKQQAAIGGCDYPPHDCRQQALLGRPGVCRNEEPAIDREKPFLVPEGLAHPILIRSGRVRALAEHFNRKSLAAGRQLLPSLRAAWMI